MNRKETIRSTMILNRDRPPPPKPLPPPLSSSSSSSSSSQPKSQIKLNRILQSFQMDYSWRIVCFANHTIERIQLKRSSNLNVKFSTKSFISLSLVLLSVMIECRMTVSFSPMTSIKSLKRFVSFTNSSDRFSEVELNNSKSSYKNFHCRFDRILENYRDDEICHLDIDLFGPDFLSHSNDSQQFNKNLFDRKYFHCRVISGFVSLRNFRFDIHSSQHLFNHSDLVFPNLEFIRDFLLVHQFQSDRSYSVNRTLGKFFPKLQGIFGHRRIENLTLYISHFDSSNRIDSVALNQICGPIKFFLSRPYFRHSPSYWRIIEHYHNRKIFSKNFPKLDWRHLLIIDDTNQNDQSRSRRESFDARLLFDDLIDEHSKLRASTLHVSIYEIDPRFYNYVENIEPKMEPKFCNQSSRLVVLSDLDYSDKQRFSSNTDRYNFERFPYDLITDLYDGDDEDDGDDNDQLLHHHHHHHRNYRNHPEHFRYHKRLDTYDICQIKNFAINLLRPLPLPAVAAAAASIHSDDYGDHHHHHNQQNHRLIMNSSYRFQFDHIYVIKLELCQSVFYYDCEIYRRFLFTPDRYLWDDQKNVWTFSFSIGSIFFLLSILILLIMMMMIVRNRYYRSNLKSLINIDMISVNQDYGLIDETRALNHHHHYHHHHRWFWQSESINDRNYHLDSIDSNKISCEISRQNLLINHQNILGKGEFGVVYEGIYHDPYETIVLNCDHQHRKIGMNSKRFEQTDRRKTSTISTFQTNKRWKVAIKQLRENSGLIDREKFIKEAKFMKTFQSNFLVKLIGICTIDEPILVVMEFMENSDLKQFLRKRYNDYMKCRDENLLPSFENIVRMSIEIADGMYYLHSRKIIHRDLASRNCMVNSDLTVKIGDFGLTRDLYERDYYRLSEEMPLPLRWMAPESIRKMIFTQATDIWSYGIVLWEIMSFGEQPYRGKPDFEVKKMITNYQCLQRPFYYFEPLWKISKQCWRKNSKRRPQFSSIIEILCPILKENRDKFEKLSFYLRKRDENPMKLSKIGFLFNDCYRNGNCLKQFSRSSSTFFSTSSSSSSSSSSTTTTSESSKSFPSCLDRNRISEIQNNHSESFESSKSNAQLRNQSGRKFSTQTINYLEGHRHPYLINLNQTSSACHCSALPICTSTINNHLFEQQEACNRNHPSNDSNEQHRYQQMIPLITKKSINQCNNLNVSHNIKTSINNNSNTNTNTNTNNHSNPNSTNPTIKANPNLAFHYSSFDSLPNSDITASTSLSIQPISFFGEMFENENNDRLQQQNQSNRNRLTIINDINRKNNDEDDGGDDDDVNFNDRFSIKYHTPKSSIFGREKSRRRLISNKTFQNIDYDHNLNNNCDLNNNIDCTIENDSNDIGAGNDDDGYGNYEIMASKILETQ